MYKTRCEKEKGGKQDAPSVSHTDCLSLSRKTVEIADGLQKNWKDRVQPHVEHEAVTQRSSTTTTSSDETTAATAKVNKRQSNHLGGTKMVSSYINILSVVPSLANIYETL